MSPARVAAGTNPLRNPRDRRLPRIAGPCGMVMFGVTGDLSRKKLMPAIYDLANRGLLPPGFSLVGFARRDWADEDFGQVVYQSVRDHARTPFREDVWRNLAEGFRFVPGSFDDPAAFDLLADTVHALEHQRGTGGNLAFYLSIPPGSFSLVCEQLKRSGLADARGEAWRRVVIEKPFGHDLASARELNTIVETVFPADSVFRIDHYLGKETVQNLLALRFANQMFEPIWNANYVDHVQITMAEDIGIGGRAGYYDGIGAARDVIQNHLLQLLALTAMEEPVSFNARDLRAEKEKVLSAVTIPADIGRDTARGQYTHGWQGEEKVVGYLEEQGVAQGLHDRDVCGGEAHRRHPTLGRGPVLPAHRQAARQAGDRDRGGLQAGAAPAVRRHGHRGARPERDRHPGAARRGHHHAVRLQGAGQPDGGPRRHDGLRVRVARSPSPAPRHTSGSSSTSCSATRRSSPATRRSSCPGRSSTRSRRGGPSTDGRSRTRPAAGVRRRRTR